MMTETEKAENEMAEAAAPGAVPEGADGGEPDPFVVLEKLKAENADSKDKLLRTLAEMENLRRRTEREIADAKLYGVTNFARDMLIFADNLSRALESLPADTLDKVEPVLKSFIEGISLTQKDFESRLIRHGVKKLEPQDQKFDPNMHEALFEIPDESVPSGTVKQVVEAGYSIGDRVLRPAKVGISRGGPKA